MKNRKIIFVTLMAVTAVIIGIICMSKVVENSWLETESKDNNLEVVSSGYNIADIGQFRYLTAEEYLETLTDENAIMAYKSDLVPFDDNMISYDEAATIGGTALEKVFPTINFREMEFHIAPKKWKLPYTNEEKVFFHGAISKENPEDHPISPSRTLEYFVYFIDAYTGELISLDAFFAETNVKSDMNREEALDYAQELAKLFGYNNYQKYYIEESDAGAGYKVFSVTFLIDDTKAVGFCFNTYEDRFIMGVSENGTQPYTLVAEKGIEVE